MNVDYKEIIRPKLTAKRYFHSLCVAEEAVILAEKYGCDTEKAYVAGILHDIMKDISKEEMLKMFKEFDIILTDVEKQAPKLWHAILGSEYIRRELKIDDEEIISAVRYHTTAKPDMTLLEKIIYLADFTSQDRDYNGVDEMRIAVREDLTVAMKEALKFSVADLVSQEKAIHPDTIAAYNQVFMNM